MQMTNVYNFVDGQQLTQRDIDHIVYNPIGYWYGKEREYDGLPFTLSNDLL